MEITRASLDEYLKELQQQREQATAQLNAIAGAIQAVQVLIEKSSAPEPEIQVKTVEATLAADAA